MHRTEDRRGHLEDVLLILLLVFALCIIWLLRNEISMVVYYFMQYRWLCSPSNQTTEGEIQETTDTEVHYM
jgi:hypothetical protein